MLNNVYYLLKDNKIIDELKFSDFTENCAILIAMSSTADSLAIFEDEETKIIWRR